MNPTARHNARQYALQALYQWQITETPLAELESQFLTHEIRKKTDLDYFKELLHAVVKQYAELDERMTAFLTNRALDELDPIELTCLRIATYELNYRLDVPYRVIINEALELTKKFGSIEGYKFVNGVLDQLAKQLRTVEITADKKS